MRHFDDEHRLLESVKNGDQAAFEVLVKRYSAYVYTMVFRYFHNRERAEEISQDVFLKAYRSVSGFEGRSRFSTWLYTIVHTTCVSVLRSNGNSEHPVENASLEVLGERHLTTAIAETEFDRQAKKRAIEQALLQVDESERMVVSLFYQAEQSVEEISRITGLSTSNVKVKLFRGRQKLKKLLEGCYKEFMF